ncbi:MAG: hypothetical protein EA349_11370 [Halomonadaceae bacterium]|nr:MAG: hypothetical protein EA349_11370 [Halomonadaceae bacterium]
MLLIGALCLSTAASGATESHTARGIEAFHNGSLPQAAQAFEQALASTDNPSARLRYNLGVVYYRQQRFRESRPLFESLSKEPDHAPLAHYNLGLISLAQERQLAAATSFERAFLLSRDDTITELARRQLARLDLDQLLHDRPGISRRWQSLIELRLGSSNNPRLLDRPQASSDTFAELLLASTGYLTGNASNGLRLGLTAVNRQFQDQREQNSAALSAQLSYDWQQGNWRHSPGISHTWLFDRRREAKRRLSAHYDLERDLFNSNGRGDLSLTYSHIQARERFASLDGHQGQAGVGYRHHLGNHRLYGQYRFIRDRRDDFASGDATAAPGEESFDGFFISQSARRHQLTTRWHYRINARWTLTSSLQYRESRFDDPLEIRSGEQQRSEDRLDRRFQATGGLRLRIGSHGFVSLQGTHTDNSSSLELYSFRRNTVAAGIGYQF